MWETIVGGLLAILGGFVATWLQVRHSRRIKISEVVAEKTVTANAEAYAFVKQVSSALKSDTGRALDFMLEKENWFFANRLFLPGKFPDKWLTLRNGLIRAQELRRDTKANYGEIGQLKSKLHATAEAAILEIYSEMDLRPIEVEDLGKAI